jgi:ABC-type uncharacterized transport system permease subunit
VQAKIPDRVGYAIPGLSDIPLIGPALFRHHPMVYLTVALALLLIWFLYRTRSGLVMRSVGESRSQHMHWVTQCAAFAWVPWWSAAPCAVWRALTFQ